MKPEVFWKENPNTFTPITREKAASELKALRWFGLKPRREIVRSTRAYVVQDGCRESTFCYYKKP